MKTLNQEKRLAVFLISLMVFSMLPLVAPIASADGARDASIQATVSPTAQTINPGEAGEYTVRVYNSWLKSRYGSIEYCARARTGLQRQQFNHLANSWCYRSGIP